MIDREEIARQVRDTAWFILLDDAAFAGAHLTDIPGFRALALAKLKRLWRLQDEDARDNIKDTTP